MQDGNKKTNIVFDEFQEITEIKDPDIEGVLRSHIQNHQAAYFFVGSRRRVLLEMFNQRRRPFFQSAINFELGKLPHDELSQFINQKFKAAKKHCPEDQAKALTAMVEDHPYYSQKLAFLCFERTDRKVTQANLNEAYADLIQTETPVFEAILQGLAPRQIALLKAIAKEPAKALMAMSYIKKHDLKSVGGIQAAIKKLNQLDLIERLEDTRWIVVDPVFQSWLTR